MNNRRKYEDIVQYCKGSVYKLEEYFSNLKGMNEPPFVFNDRKHSKYYELILKELGFSRKKLLDIVKTGVSFEKYSASLQKAIFKDMDKLADIMNKFKRAENTIEYEIMSLLGYIESIYTLELSKRFVFHTKQSGNNFDFAELPDLAEDYPIDRCFDLIDDCYICFSLNNKEYSNLYIRVMKSSTYMRDIKTDKVETEILNFSILKAVDNLDSKMAVEEFSVMRDSGEKRIYSSNFGICNGLDCPYNLSTKYSIYAVDYDNERELVDSLNIKDYCNVSKAKISNNHCVLGIFAPYKIISLCAYMWDMYDNRQSITRKNSKRREKVANMPISIHERREDDVNNGLYDDSYAVIDVTNYYKYEREKKEWQGGHHNSPVEHERRGHERIYRNEDGTIKKIVNVRPSTINKGGKKAIYSVSIKETK